MNSINHIDHGKMSGGQKLILWIVIIAAFMGMGLAGQNDLEAKKAEESIQQLQSENRAVQRAELMSAAHTICNNSRLSDSGRDEQSCSDFLEKHQLDFICNTRDNNPSTVCHVDDVSDAYKQ